MPIEIRKTIVTPADDDHDVVQLYISDALPDDESATLVVQILLKQRALRVPSLAQLQRDTMKEVQEALQPIIQGLAKEMRQEGYGDVPPRKPKR